MQNYFSDDSRIQWRAHSMPVLKLGGVAQINFGENILLNILELMRKKSKYH